MCWSWCLVGSRLGGWKLKLESGEGLGMRCQCEIEIEVELVVTKQGCWEVTRSVQELVVLAEAVHFGEPADTWELLPDTELW